VILRDQTKFDFGVRDLVDHPTSTRITSSVSFFYFNQEAKITRTSGQERAKGRDRGGKYARFELIFERLLVQEHVRILVLFVEPVFHLLHARDHTLEVAVPREDHKGGVRALAGCSGIVWGCNDSVVAMNGLVSSILDIDRVLGFGNGREVAGVDAVVGARAKHMRLEVAKRGRMSVALVGEGQDEVKANL
jgi:hypothetical protein